MANSDFFGGLRPAYSSSFQCNDTNNVSDSLLMLAYREYFQEVLIHSNLIYKISDVDTDPDPEV